MKTPREILLERHRQAGPKLDALRREALGTVEKIQPESSPVSWRELLRSFRWHAVGLSAAWLFIMFLHEGASRPQGMMAAVPPAKIPPPQAIMASLRENRRQLSEIIGADASAAKPLELFVPKPRSERREVALAV